MDYNEILSERAKEIKPSGIRKFFDIVLNMDNAISLGVGEPDFATPWSSCDAAIRSIQKGLTQYTSNCGLFELRENISKYLLKVTENIYSPKDEIIVTAGASEAIDLSLRALINNGDEILIPEPSYVSYAPCVQLQGGVAVPIPCSHESDFKVTAQALEGAITAKTKAVILPYPNNPTGAILEKPFLESIAEVIKKHNLMVVSDEIYSELTYGQKHCSIASLPDMRERTIVINGFSKTFAMTGWRLGYVAAPREIICVILKIHQYVIMCAPTPSQYAGIAALKDGFSDNFKTVEDMKHQYDMRRRFVVKRLREMGLICFEPKGAFYVFPCVKSTGLNGDEFSIRLLEQQKVAVVPGSAFGESGKDYVRISYAYSMSTLDKALARIENFVKGLKNEK